jgi:5-methylcytosine-specific restriction endonuclease McrA
VRISSALWNEVFVRDNGYCQYCGQDLLFCRAAYAGAQVDHVRAVAVGGKDELDNLKLACSSCNGSLSRYNHLTSFEERKVLMEQKNITHEKNYQAIFSKLRNSHVQN